jgi:hypothetical protein
MAFVCESKDEEWAAPSPPFIGNPRGRVVFHKNPKTTWMESFHKGLEVKPRNKRVPKEGNPMWPATPP